MIAQCRVLLNIDVPDFHKVIGVLLVVPETIVLQVLFFRYVVEFIRFTKLVGIGVCP
jgi:hypothetical protein